MYCNLYKPVYYDSVKDTKDTTDQVKKNNAIYKRFCK